MRIELSVKYHLDVIGFWRVLAYISILTFVYYTEWNGYKTRLLLSVMAVNSQIHPSDSPYCACIVSAALQKIYHLHI
jgi:hypothetical protein